MSDRTVSNNPLLDFSNRKSLLPIPEDLYQLASEYFTSKELDLLQKAHSVASEAHKDQIRQEGSPYITHPVAVAETLLKLHLDVETVCAGLMHCLLYTSDAADE